jgi:hypothetical protein
MIHKSEKRTLESKRLSTLLSESSHEKLCSLLSDWGLKETENHSTAEYVNTYVIDHCCVYSAMIVSRELSLSVW